MEILRIYFRHYFAKFPWNHPNYFHIIFTKKIFKWKTVFFNCSVARHSVEIAHIFLHDFFLRNYNFFRQNNVLKKNTIKRLFKNVNFIDFAWICVKMHYIKVVEKGLGSKKPLRYLQCLLMFRRYSIFKLINFVLLSLLVNNIFEKFQSIDLWFDP